jgi:hypothetical protein
MDIKLLGNSEELAFSLEHGKNTTNRMVESLLIAIAQVINTSHITYEGKSCRLKCLGAGVSKSDETGEWRLLFDVLDPNDMFDHVEFKITKTGWGRSMVPVQSEAYGGEK